MDPERKKSLIALTGTAAAHPLATLSPWYSPAITLLQVIGHHCQHASLRLTFQLGCRPRGSVRLIKHSEALQRRPGTVTQREARQRYLTLTILCIRGETKNRGRTLCWKEDHPSGQPEGGWGDEGTGGMVPVTFTLLQMCGRSEWHFWSAQSAVGWKTQAHSRLPHWALAVRASHAGCSHLCWQTCRRTCDPGSAGAASRGPRTRS